MWETWVQSLDWEDPPEKGMATHSSILAWRIPWIEEPQFSSVQSLSRVLLFATPYTAAVSYKESNMTEQLTLAFLAIYSILYI